MISHKNYREQLTLFLEKEKKDSSPVRYTANGYTSYGAENILTTAGFEDQKTL